MFGKQLRAVAAFLRAERVRVQGWSMYPCLAPEDYVLVDRLAYRQGQPLVGEIVLARDPRDHGREILKRIAGVPGDQVNTRALGPGEYYLLGDNPDFSTDSRTFGPVPRGDIVGRGWLVYWPAERFRVLIHRRC